MRMSVHLFLTFVIQLQQRNQYSNRIPILILMYSKQKMESIKQSAYFDYFKFFSINAAQTIRKLQTTFKDEISEDVFFDANHMFRRIKTLLSSYQILLMQIKDSCEFVEIPQFGICIMKIFFQLMAIIKFMAKSIILRSGIEKSNEKEKRADQRHTMISTSPSQFYQNTIKTTSPHTQERDNFRMKEMASHIFQDIKQQVANLEKQQKKDELENDKTFEKISKGRQRLQQIQSSKSEAVLSETVNMLYKKSEHINSFINIVQTNIALQSKQYSVDTYLKIKQQFDEECLPRFENAKEKLNKIFKQHIIEYQSKKKSAMVHHECQVKIQQQQLNNQDKLKSSFHSTKKSHHTNDQIRKLRNQLKLSEQQNRTLKIFIQQKCQQYENIITKLRSQKIILQNKINPDNVKNIEKFKSNSSKKSQSYIENIQNTDNVSQIHSHISLESESKELFHTFDFSNKKSKVNVNRTNKSRVKFLFNQKNLSIYSKVIHYTVSKDDKKGEESNKAESFAIQHKQTIFQEIEQRPSENQCSFRDTPGQVSQTLLKHKYMQRSKKQRSSLLISTELKQNSKQILAQTDQSSFAKVKKPFHPHCSLNTKKLMNIRLQQQRRQSKNTIELSNDKLLKIQTLKNVNSNQTIDKSSNKINTKQTKLSIFYKLQRQIQKRHSNNNQPVDYIKNMKQTNSEPNEPSTDKKIVKFNKINFEGIQIRQLQSCITFDQSDLNSLFLTESNAQNYQILNITLLTKNNQFFSMLHNKNIYIKDLPKSNGNTRKASCQNLSPKYQQKEQTICIADILISITYKYLKFLKLGKKQNQINYHRIKNFIRFPYSSVYKQHEKQWKQHEAQNNAIQLLQLKKYIGRIVKMHLNCSKSNIYNSIDDGLSCEQKKVNEQTYLCNHWRSFMIKIGVILAEIHE